MLVESEAAEATNTLHPEREGGGAAARTPPTPCSATAAAGERCASSRRGDASRLVEVELAVVESLRSQRRETARTTPRLSTECEQAIADARSAYIHTELTVGRKNDLVRPRPTSLFHGVFGRFAQFMSVQRPLLSTGVSTKP